MGTNDFWTNVYNQVHNWISTLGLAIALAVAEYLINNQDKDWTWKAVLIACLGAFVKYFLTRDDHVKTTQAVEKAAVTGEVPGKEES